MSDNNINKSHQNRTKSNDISKVMEQISLVD